VYAIDLRGKTGLITGVANKRSIAWAIAQILHQAGARLAFTYQGERIKESVEELISPLQGSLLLPLDVLDDSQLTAVFRTLESEFGRLDYLVHSVAFAPHEEFEREFYHTSRAGFRTALEISAYSLVPMAKLALPLMERAGGGSMIAMTYLAAERAVPTYNVMGTAKAALEQIIRQLAFELGPKKIRVNGISAGPLSTLSARGVPGFTDILHVYEERAPLKRNITHEEVAKAALFLLSDLSSGITGEIIYVDSGFHIMGF
jgi:enoyl-[acyl-carrier protein] reductase I